MTASIHPFPGRCPRGAGAQAAAPDPTPQGAAPDLSDLATAIVDEGRLDRAAQWMLEAGRVLDQLDRVAGTSAPVRLLMDDGSEVSLAELGCSSGLWFAAGLEAQRMAYRRRYGFWARELRAAGVREASLSRICGAFGVTFRRELLS